MYREEDKLIIDIALELSYMVFNTIIVEENEINQYINAFYKSIQETNSKFNIDYFSKSDCIYNYVKDKNNKGYFILDLNKLKSLGGSILSIVPQELVLLFKKENVLSTLGIEIKDKKFIPKQELKNKKL